MKIKLPIPWTFVREKFLVLFSSYTQSGVFCSIVNIDDTSVLNDVPLCFWEYEMTEIETKFELFDKIEHSKVKERQGEITAITFYWKTISYYCWNDEINENYAEPLDEKKVWFST